MVRARAIAKHFARAAPILVIIDKRRPRPNEAQVMHIIGDVKNRDCIIVDDICRQQAPCAALTEALKNHGAARSGCLCDASRVIRQCH